MGSMIAHVSNLFRISIICLAFLFFGAIKHYGATVVGTSYDLTGANYAGQLNQIQFVPVSTPQVIGGNPYWPITSYCQTTNAGTFSITLAAGGIYDASPVSTSPFQTVRKIRLYVPINDTNVWTFADCVNLLANLVVGTNYNSPINASFATNAGGIFGVISFTNLPGGIVTNAYYTNTVGVSLAGNQLALGTNGFGGGGGAVGSVSTQTNWLSVRYSTTLTNQYYFSNAPNSSYNGTYVFKSVTTTNGETVLIYTNGTKGLIYYPVSGPNWIVQSVTSYDGNAATWVYDNSISATPSEPIGSSWEDAQLANQVNIGAAMLGSTINTPLVLPSGDGALLTNVIHNGNTGITLGGNFSGVISGDGTTLSNVVASSTTFSAGLPSIGLILNARAAINRAVSGSSPCYIFFTGDSTTSGKGGGNAYETNSLINSFQYDLCKMSPWVNGDGWMGTHAGGSSNYWTAQDPRFLSFGDFVAGGYPNQAPMNPGSLLVNNTSTNSLIFRTTCVADSVLVVMGFSGGIGNVFISTNGVIATTTNSSIGGFPGFGIVRVPLPSNTNSVNIAVWKTNAASSLTIAGMIPNYSNSITTINCGSEGSTAFGIHSGINAGTNLMQKLGFTNCINIVSIGLNDVANSSFSNQLNTVWTNLIPYGTATIQMSMTPAVNGGSGNYSTNVLWISSIANKLSLPFIDPWTYFNQPQFLSSSPYSWDGLHMNQAGYLEVSKIILDSLKIPTYKKP